MEANNVKQIKQPNTTQEITKISFDTQDFFNEAYINDLTSILKTNLIVPTYTPKKWVDCFYLYFDGTSTYKLYIYISNTWKSVTIS